MGRILNDPSKYRKRTDPAIPRDRDGAVRAPRKLTVEERQRMSENLADIGRGGHRHMPFGSLLNK